LPELEDETERHIEAIDRRPAEPARLRAFSHHVNKVGSEATERGATDGLEMRSTTS
jgi:hypothetical protein